jgi:Domain of unknown function (DUF4263)
VPSDFYHPGEAGARLNLSRPSPGHWAVHYVAPPNPIEDGASSHPKSFLLIEGDLQTGIVTTYPLITNPNRSDFLTRKYTQLRTVTFEEIHSISIIEQSAPTDIGDVRNMMLNLPPGFVKDPFFGLGLNTDIKYLVHAVEELPGITDLCLRRQTKDGRPTIEGSSYVISLRLFEKARRAILRIHDQALSAARGQKRVSAYNAILTAIDPLTYPTQINPYRNNMLSQTIGTSIKRDVPLSAADQRFMVKATQAVVRPLTRNFPREMLALSEEIETISLENLIKRLKSRLDKQSNESAWQAFFEENHFVLRLAFGLPVLILNGQFSVGGRRFSGSGDKIADFAARALASGNMALIEIKTPQTPLLETRPYRAELYAPGRELSGAINQVLEQRYLLQKHIDSLKIDSRNYDVETYAVHCLIVAGRTPQAPAALKSLELFRNSLKSVSVVTFDELLGKLEQLLDFLKDTSAENGADI